MKDWEYLLICNEPNLSVIPPAEHYFEHNTLVSRVTPESIILYFSSIIQQTLQPSFNSTIQQVQLLTYKSSQTKYNVTGGFM